MTYGEYWAVLEFDEKDIVYISKNKCKVKKCKIVYLSKFGNGLLKYFDASKFDSKNAFYWATYVGDEKIMRDQITDSRYAYFWARDIGDRKIMIDRITNSEDAYFWARDIGNRKNMTARFPKITKYFEMF